MVDEVTAWRRLLRVQLGLLVATVVVAAVLVAAASVRAALDIIHPWQADLFVVLSVLIPLAQLHLLVLTRKRRVNEVQHWLWLLFPIHLYWAGGFLVGIAEAVPIAIGVGLLDLLALRRAQEAAAFA